MNIQHFYLALFKYQYIVRKLLKERTTSSGVERLHLEY